MNNKKLAEKIAEETIMTSNQNIIWERIQKAKSSKEATVFPKMRLLKIATSLLSLALIIAVSIIIYKALTPKDNGQPLANKPPVYGAQDLIQRNLSIEELGDLYPNSIDISGFKPHSILLYETADENKIPVHLKIKYVRDLVMNAPMDNDIIILNIVLNENYQLSNDSSYSDDALKKSFSLTIESQEFIIQYLEQGDQGDGTWDGFNNVKTKFVFENYTYYIDIRYYLFDEKNILESIVTDLIN
jgi:hypothetical protein